MHRNLGPSAPRFNWRLSGTLAVAAVGCTAGLLAVVGPGLGLDLTAALRDPTFAAVEQGVLPVEAGAVSYLGILLWWSAATASLLAAWVLRDRDAPHALLVSSGALSIGLGIDDLYLVHDLLWPRYTGLSDTPVLMGWVLLIGLWAAWNRAALGRTPLLPLLWLAGGAFAASIAADQMLTSALIAEDASKLVGIALWAAFHVGVATTAVRAQLLGQVALERVAEADAVRPGPSPGLGVKSEARPAP